MAGNRTATLLRPSRNWAPLTKTDALTLSGGVITDATRLTGTEGDGAAYPDSSVYVPPAATNLETNGGSETNTTTHDATSNASISRSNEKAKFGSYSIKVVTSGVGANEGLRTNFGSANRLAVSPSTTYTVSRWVWVPTGGSVWVVVSEYTAVTGGSFVTSTGSGTASGNDNWQRVTLTVTTAGTTNAIDILTVTKTTQATTYYVDGRQTETGSIATPYIHTDGGTASRSVGEVKGIPRNLLSPAGGGFAFRWVAGQSSTAATTNAQRPRLLNAVNSNNFIVAYYDYATDKWLLARDNGSGSGESVVSAAQSFAQGDVQTLIFEWSSTELSVQVNNTSPVTAASTKAPLEANLPATFSFGTSSEPPWGALKWAYGWSGVLSTADRAKLVGLGNNDPLPHQLLGGAIPKFLAHFNGDGTEYRYS